MLTTDELIASAKGCGLETQEYKPGTLWHDFPKGTVIVMDRNWVRWNPPENAEQNWMCLKELLRRGYGPLYLPNDEHSLLNIAEDTLRVVLGADETCPAEEFSAKALAKVECE